MSEEEISIIRQQIVVNAKDITHFAGELAAFGSIVVALTDRVVMAEKIISVLLRRGGVSRDELVDEVEELNADIAAQREEEAGQELTFTPDFDSDLDPDESELNSLEDIQKVMGLIPDEEEDKDED